MDFNDINYLQETFKTNDLEIEPLFWKMEDSLFSGKTKTATLIHKAFLYIAKINPLLLKNLNPKYINRLKEITFELHSDYVSQKKRSIEMQMSIEPVDLPFKKEADLRDYLYNNKHILNTYIGEKIDYIEKEVTTCFESRCDIIIENDINFLPIELKIVQSNHAVIYQILKYCDYFYRQLRYSRYRDIQGVVISNGFDDCSINELRRNGIRCFYISYIDDVILREITPPN